MCFFAVNKLRCEGQIFSFCDGWKDKLGGIVDEWKKDKLIAFCEGISFVCLILIAILLIVIVSHHFV